MNLGNLAGAGGALTGYLQTPDGQQAVMKFLASPQGSELLKQFVGTPDGMKTMAGLIPQVAGGLNLPPEATSMITAALAARQ